MVNNLVNSVVGSIYIGADKRTILDNINTTSYQPLSNNNVLFVYLENAFGNSGVVTASFKSGTQRIPTTQPFFLRFIKDVSKVVGGEVTPRHFSKYILTIPQPVANLNLNKTEPLNIHTTINVSSSIKFIGTFNTLVDLTAHVGSVEKDIAYVIESGIYGYYEYVLDNGSLKWLRIENDDISRKVIFSQYGFFDIGIQGGYFSEVPHTNINDWQEYVIWQEINQTNYRLAIAETDIDDLEVDLGETKNRVEQNETNIENLKNRVSENEFTDLLKAKLDSLLDGTQYYDKTYIDAQDQMLDDRIDNIIVGTVEGVSDAEIIDARKGFELLSDKISNIDKNILFEKEKRNNNVEIEPLITFIDDDISPDVWTRLQPLFESQNVPCVLATPLSFVNEYNIDNLLYVQNILGWEIASHGNLHHKPLTECTDNELYNELQVSYDELNKKGLHVNNLVYPFGNSDKRVRQYASKIYDSGITTNNLQLNSIPLKQYSIGRTALGSYYDPIGESELGDTLEYYKSKVDEAVLNKQWIVFMLHIAPTSETQLGYIDELIDYIKLQSVRITTVREALKIYGNTIFNGDYVGNYAEDNYYIVSNTGLKVENKISKSEYDYSTLIADYPLGVTTKTYYTVDNAGFPYYDTGLVITYKEKEDIEGTYFSYQLYRPYGSYGVLIRYVNSDGSWSSFRNITNDVITYKTITSSSVLTDFDNNSTIYSKYDDTNSAGFPHGAGGLLETKRYDDNNGRQIFYSKNNQGVWNRYWDIGGSTWTPWVNTSLGLPKITMDIDFGVVNAKTSKGVIVTYQGATYGDFVVASPYNYDTLPKGFSIYASQYDANDVVVTIVNSTDSDVTVGSKSITIKVFRN